MSNLQVAEWENDKEKVVSGRVGGKDGNFRITPIHYEWQSAAPIIHQRIPQPSEKECEKVGI